jgi:membrane protein XagC
VTRLSAAVPLAAFAFVMALMLVALAVRNGLVPDDSLRLWAGATSAGDGEISIGRIVAAYPTLPFVATALVALFSFDGTPAPALLAAGVLALVAGLWFGSFRAAGFSLVTAAIITLILAFHPAMLRAIVGGPADLCLVLFLYLFASALYELRVRGTASEVMAVGLVLVGLAFSHPIGAAIAFASVPFLIFAVQPNLAASSALNVVVALVFPAVFAVGAFYYLAWVFPGAGWSFFAAPAESLAAWRAGVAAVIGDAPPGLLALDASLAIAIALALGAPLVVVAIGLAFRRRPLVTPALVFIATLIAAAAVAVASSMAGEPSVIAVGAPVLTAIVVARVPLVRERLTLFVPLLAAGWLGGAASIVIVDPLTVTRVSALLHGDGDRERLDTLALGGAMVGRDGILADTDNSPAIVLGRGRAHGLLEPAGEPFALALLFGRLDTPFVAVPDPQSNAGANDRVDKAFPALYRHGAAGYRVIYQNTTWRLFAK